MAKKVFDSEHEAETSWQRAIDFTRNVRGDEERADEIEDEGLDQWLEETGRRIKNASPIIRRTNNMAKASSPTRAELLEQVSTLEEENRNLNGRLNQIFDIAAEPDEESEDDDFDEDEDLDEEDENDDD